MTTKTSTVPQDVKESTINLDMIELPTKKIELPQDVHKLIINLDMIELPTKAFTIPPDILELPTKAVKIPQDVQKSIINLSTIPQESKLLPEITTSQSFKKNPDHGTLFLPIFMETSFPSKNCSMGECNCPPPLSHICIPCKGVGDVDQTCKLFGKPIYI